MNRPTLVVVALIVVSLIGCGTRDTDVAQIMHAPPPPAAVEPAGPITVASFDFTESRMVAEIYAQAFEASGYPVERAPGVAAHSGAGSPGGPDQPADPPAVGPDVNRRTERNVGMAGLELVSVRREGVWREIEARPPRAEI